MKANELRIGNWVRLREHDAFIQIEQYQLCESELINVQPIQLTEEWLLKFGFYETTKQDYVSGLYTRAKRDGFYINKETMCYCEIDYEGTTNDIIEIKYVHQLQNLYFALTGEELTPNE